MMRGARRFTLIGKVAANLGVDMSSHIMIAVKDPYAKRNDAINRGLEWASAHAARVTLLHSVFIPALANVDYYAPHHLQAEIAAEVERCQRGLQRLAKPFKDAGIDVHLRVRWDYPVHDSVVREVIREKIDLLIIHSHRHTTLSRLFLSNTDWQLLRLCPCPILIVKSANPYPKKPLFMVSVDPVHSNDKPAALDQRLLKIAQSFAQGCRAAVHLVHFYMPLLPISAGLMVDPTPLPLEIQQQHTHRIKKAFQRLIQKAKLGPRHAHLREGTAVDDLPDFVKKTKTNLLVMGAVSRSTMKRLFIGATAETVIDALECDVLIVKPEDFKSPVPKKSPHPALVLPPV